MAKLPDDEKARELKTYTDDALRNELYALEEFVENNGVPIRNSMTRASARVMLAQVRAEIECRVHGEQ